MSTITITVPATRYQDHDDCLAAAAADYIAKHPGLRGWDLAPQWADDQRDEIALTIPVLVADRIARAVEAQRAARLKSLAEPTLIAPPPVTHKAPLAVLRTMRLQPFAVWSHASGAYLEIPTIWAVNPQAAIRQLAATRDPGARVTDRHGRKPSRRTRELRVVWSSGFEAGLLRADLQPWPAEGEESAPMAPVTACPTCGAPRTVTP